MLNSINNLDDEPPPKKKGSVFESIERLGGDLKEIEKVKKKYPMKITPYYFNLIKSKDDPIWLQSIPDAKELDDTLNIPDPLKEEDFTKVPYIVHKYPDRVLLLASSKCAMYCRFCTRKRKVGRVEQIPIEEILNSIEYIKEHKEIRDVIISGGDPLTRTDEELESIIKALRDIPHIEIIRVGTRMPCVYPSRITPNLVNMLKKYHPIYMNIHFNHAMEITEESSTACRMLADAGIPLGSQTVLLKGVNDNPEDMKELMQALLKIRVKPYYIYECDQVQGVEHFRTKISKGIDILKNLYGFTSGLCVPHFVVDGEFGKVPVSPDFVKEKSEDKFSIENYKGKIYDYSNPIEQQVTSFSQGQNTKIGLVYNSKKEPGEGEVHDKYAEFDDMSTILAIKIAIESGGYDVSLIEANESFLNNISKDKVDFVFNIAEGMRGESRESHVPAILEMLGIPYSGSGVFTQSVTLHKNRTKEVLSYHGVNAPKSRLFHSSKDLEKDFGLKFPLIVKPNNEGSSKGINNKSLVFNNDDLKEQISFITANYSQPALAEEYLEGREFTVSILGNENPKVLPIVEITFDHLPEGIHKFDSYEVKWIYDSPDSPVDPVVCPANITEPLKEKIEKTALAAYKAVGCVDFCRMDIRLDSDEEPHVIDINALPGLMPDPKENSRFPRSCFTAGMSYNDIILNVLHEGMERNDLQEKMVKRT